MDSQRHTTIKFVYLLIYWRFENKDLKTTMLSTRLFNTRVVTLFINYPGKCAQRARVRKIDFKKLDHKKSRYKPALWPTIGWILIIVWESISELCVGNSGWVIKQSKSWCCRTYEIIYFLLEWTGSMFDYWIQ